jgi:hypothetical protein
MRDCHVSHYQSNATIPDSPAVQSQLEIARTIGLLDEGGTGPGRETVLSTIHEQRKLTPELRAKIGGALVTSFR